MKAKRSAYALLLATAIVLSVIPFPTIAHAKDYPVITMVNYPEYVHVGEPLYYEVAVENVSSPAAVSYRWMFTIESLMGSYSSSGVFKWSVGDTSDGWYYASEATKWCKGYNTSRFELDQDFVDESVGLQYNPNSTWLYKCEVTVGKEKYYTPILKTVVLPENLVETIDVKGLEVPELGGTPDTTVSVKAKHTNLVEVEWVRKDKNGIGYVRMQEGETFTDGLYAVNIYLEATDDYHFDYNGKTAVTLNGKTQELQKSALNGNQAVISRCFSLTKEVEEGMYADSDFTQMKTGNYYKVIWELSADDSLGKNSKIPSFAKVQIVSPPEKGSDYAVVQYEGIIEYVHMGCLQFYGYGDGTLGEGDDLSGTCLRVAPKEGVNITWKSPTGRFIAKLPYGTVITVLRQVGLYVEFRYGGYKCYAPRSAFYYTYNDTAADDLTDLIDQSGFYRVTVSSLTVRNLDSKYGDRVLGLKKGDIVYVESYSEDEWAMFHYQGDRVYAQKQYLEKIDVTELEDLDPVITKDLEDVTINEGETAVFTLQATAPVLNDYPGNLDEYGYPLEYGSNHYEFSTSISCETITSNGWGEVVTDHVNGELQIQNCTRELDGMTVLAGATNYGTAISSMVTLHVIPDETKEETEDLEVSWTNPTISIVKRSLDIHSDNGEVLDEGMDEEGDVVLKIFPHANEEFTEKSAKKIKINGEFLKLKRAEKLESGEIKVELTAADPEEAVNSSPDCLNITSGSAKGTEGVPLAEAIKAENTTGQEPVWEIVGGELPEGVAFDAGEFSGTPVSGSAGIYPITLKVHTDPVTKQVQKQVTTYVGESYTEAETGPISLTVSAADVTAIKNAARGHGEITRGYYRYIFDLLPGNYRVRYYDASSGDNGDCAYTENGDGSMTLNHTGKRDVQKTRQVPKTTTQWVEEEVYPACESNAQFILTIAPKHVHTYQKAVRKGQDPDCEKGIIYEYTCECGDVQEMTEYGSHVFSPWSALEGDCVTGLVLERICTVCGKTEMLKQEPSPHEDMNCDGVCDHCFYDPAQEVVAAMLEVSVEDVKGGNLSAVLEQKNKEYDEEFYQAGCEETEETGAGRKNLPWWLLLLILLILSAGAGTCCYIRKKARKKEQSDGTEGMRP